MFNKKQARLRHVGVGKVAGVDSNTKVGELADVQGNAPRSGVVERRIHQGDAEVVVPGHPVGKRPVGEVVLMEGVHPVSRGRRFAGHPR